MKCRFGALLALLLATSSLADPPSPCMMLAQFNPGASSNFSDPSTLSQETKNDPRVRLERPKQIIPLVCNRPFLYRGEFYSVDSPQAQDAETLKTITRDVKQSQIFLSKYQENRNRVRISAYTGTLGAALALFSTGLGRWLSPRNPSTIQTAALLAGAAVAVEGFSYSLWLLRENGNLLNQAVDAHNREKPKDPIELQFSAGWSF